MRARVPNDSTLLIIDMITDAGHAASIVKHALDLGFAATVRRPVTEQEEDLVIVIRTEDGQYAAEGLSSLMKLASGAGPDQPIASPDQPTATQ
jgi:hypothetical protein